MLEHARHADPDGEYVLIGDGDLHALEGRSFQLVLSAFAFDNIPGTAHRAAILGDLRRLLAPGGRVVLVCSAPELYINEWVSFTTREFTSNASARSGDTVWIVMTDVDDRRPIPDLLWRHQDYLDLFRDAGLDLLHTHRPLAPGDETGWVSEQHTPPWTLYVAGVS